MAINKASIATDIWDTFFTFINANVTDPRASERTKWIYTSFPNVKIGDTLNMTSTEDYPIMIIEPAKFNWDELTLKKKWVDISITIEVYTTSAVQSDSLISEITDTVETQRPTLYSEDKITKLNLDDVDDDTVFRGKLKLHVRTATFTMRYSFTGSL